MVMLQQEKYLDEGIIILKKSGCFFHALFVKFRTRGMRNLHMKSDRTEILYFLGTSHAQVIEITSAPAWIYTKYKDNGKLDIVATIFHRLKELLLVSAWRNLPSSKVWLSSFVAVFK